MSDHTRLAAAQGRFVSALTAGDELPSGFDLRGSSAMSTILLGKRRKAMMHAVPVIARVLGPEFVVRFDAFARANALPANAGALVDAIAFLRWLRRNDALPAELRWLALKLRWQRVMRR